MRSGDLGDRLRRAYRVEVDDDTAARQMSAIAAELGTAEAPPAKRHLRRRVAALAAVLAVALPGGLAVAAEGTLPGDVLYPVKLVTEQVRSVIDPAVSAEHRLDEVERMLERQVPLTRVVDHLQVADRTLSTLPDHDELDRRFDHVVDLVRDRIGPDRIPTNGFPRHRTGHPRDADSPRRRDSAEPGLTETSPDRDVYDRDPSREELDVPDDAVLDTDTDMLIHDRITDGDVDGGMDMPGDGGGMPNPGG